MSESERRNVVLVTIDSLRADHCGFMGYDRHTTPTLDVMAEEGVAFRNAVAPGPKTPESMPAIFTGHYPGAFRSSSDIKWRDQIYPHMQAHMTIPERFSRRGYDTVAFTPNGFTSRFFGFDRGFDHFEDFLDNEIRPGLAAPNVLRGVIKWVRREGNWKQWEGYYDQIIDSVERVSEPYFLWVFLLDVHSPYLAPRAFRTNNSWFEMVYANWKSTRGVEKSGSFRKKLVDAYDDTIRYTDAFLEQLTTDLRDTDPVYVVHADHGEAFGEHGYYGHERLLYRENVHVPLVVSNVSSSGDVEKLISLRELPRMLDLAGNRTGDDLRDDIAESITDPSVITKSMEGRRVGVQLAHFKLIIEPDGERVLYDLSSDPHEQVDIARDKPGICRTLATLTDGYMRAEREENSIRQATRDVFQRNEL